MRGMLMPGVSALLIASAACGGGGDGVTGNGGGGGGGGGGTPNFSITLTATPTDVSIPMGETRQVTLTVTRGGNYGGAVTFGVEGLPSYVDATFNPPTVGGPATSTSTLSLTAAAGATVGAYSIVVRASGDSVTTQRVTLNCSLVQVPKIGITLGTTSVAVTRGSSANVVVAISRSGGFAGPVNLAVDGPPEGLTAVFAPNPADGPTSTLSLTAASTLAPNDYQVTVHGTGTGVADVTVPLAVSVGATPSYSLAAEPTSLSVTPPGTATVKIEIERTGGFTGAVSLFPEAFPVGVTATIAPFPATGNNATMTVTVGETTGPGAHTLYVRGEAPGQPNRKTAVGLTVEVTRGFTLRASSAPITLVPGGSEQGVNIAIDRTGGFDGEVAFSATGAPAGFSVRFSPASTTGTASVVFIKADASVVPGTATIQVVGSAAGLANRTATILINVVAGGTSIAWRFCSTTGQPVFFAYADGATMFTAVSPNLDGSYTINIATGKGTVLYVLPGFTPLETDRMRQRLMPSALAYRAAALSAGYTTHVSYATTAELQALAQPDCPLSALVKNVSGSVAGVSADQGYGVALADALAFGMPGDPATFTLTGVPDGAHDLLSARLLLTAIGVDDYTATPNKLIVRRGLNPSSGEALPVLDFNGSDAFEPATAPVTITDTNGAQVEVTSAFSTANGTNTFLSAGAFGGGTAHTFFGLPTSRLLPGDMHWVIASDDRGRNATVFSHEVVPRTVPLGPEMSPPLVGVYSTTPTLRLHAVLNGLGPVDTQYGGSFEVTLSQPGLQRAIVFSYSRGAIGTSNNVEVRTPVLTNIPSWNEGLYALQSGSQVQWMIDAWNVATPFVPADGAVLRWASFTGNFTP